MKNPRNILSSCLTLFSILLIAFALSVFTIPFIFASFIACLIAALLSRSREVFPVLTVALTLFSLLGLAEIFLVWKPSSERPHYYRPDETLIGTGDHRFDEHFLPNETRINFAMPFGDISGMSVLGNVGNQIKQPRVVSYYTDNLGYRNRDSFADQNVILFGDSFTVGSGTDQADTLAEVLTNTYKYSTYSAAFPGDIASYQRKIDQMRRIARKPFFSVMVVFEGNDFPCQIKPKPIRGERYFTYIPPFIANLETYRVMFGLTRRAALIIKARGSDPYVEVKQIGEQMIGFHRGYIEITKRTSPCDEWSIIEDSLTSVQKQVNLLVFIPEKYRVYYPRIRGEGEEDLPNVQSQFLATVATRHNIPFLDLTHPLEEIVKSARLESDFPWWRDDTHWGPSGIKLAAKMIAARISDSDIK